MAEKALSTRLCGMLGTDCPTVLVGVGAIAGAELVLPLSSLVSSAS